MGDRRKKRRETWLRFKDRIVKKGVLQWNDLANIRLTQSEIDKDLHHGRD